MSSINSQLNWEEFFIQEAVDLEEKMLSIDIGSLNKSRLRIALENGILHWDKYLAWYSQSLPCTNLYITEDNDFINQLVAHSKHCLNIYSHFNHWSEDLIPLQVWNGDLIVLGLQYNENLSELDNVIFVAASPELLSQIYLQVQEIQSDSILNDNDLKISADNSLSGLKLDNVDLSISKPKISFASLTGTVDEKTNAEESTNLTDVQNIEFWDYVTDRHEEYSFEAKKQFDAYLVLKITQGKTKIFKSDTELEKIGLKASDFSFDLKEDNPFHQVFYSENSVVFNVSQIQKTFNFNLSPYKYMCVSALKRGGDILGFLVGLKKSALSEKDEYLLNDLAKESA